MRRLLHIVHYTMVTFHIHLPGFKGIKANLLALICRGYASVRPPGARGNVTKQGGGASQAPGQENNTINHSSFLL